MSLGQHKREIYAIQQVWLGLIAATAGARKNPSALGGDRWATGFFCISTEESKIAISGIMHCSEARAVT